MPGRIGGGPGGGRPGGPGGGPGRGGPGGGHGGAGRPGGPGGGGRPGGAIHGGPGHPFLHHHRPVPHGLMFYFTQVADLRHARDILCRLSSGIPVAPFDQDFLVRMFGRPVGDPHMARELLQWLDYELGYY